jgi:maltose O-acetyltransferase
METENTAVELRLKALLGTRGAEHLRVATKTCLRWASHAPLQCLRLLALRLAGAKIGQDIVLAPGVEIFSPWRLSIGSHTNIGRCSHLDSRGDLRIGDNVNISDEVAIWTAEHDVQSVDFRMTRGPVTIGNRVWICFRSIIMPGVRLGEGSVIAAGSIVTRNVEPFTIVAGVPAKAIGCRNRELTYQLGDPRNDRGRGAST